MRRMSYVPIDAAKHRSSHSRVPGLRAGHSFMWSQPVPKTAAPCDQFEGIFGRIGAATKPLLFVLSTTDARKNSCFRRPLEIRFVLSTTIIRAFGDRHSCF